MIKLPKRSAPLKPLMPAGICNKCGDAGDLVLAGCVCANCSDALDRHWASSTATDWVLIATQGPTRPPLRPFVHRYPHWNANYAEMKSLWATWSNGPHVQFTGLIERDEIAEMRLALGGVAERTGIPFIRPATQSEIAEHERSLRSHRAHEERTATFRKWHFDPLGRSLTGTDDHSSWDRRSQAINEIRDRLAVLGLLEYAGLDVLRQHWGDDNNDTPCDPTRFFMIRDCPNCGKSNRIPAGHLADTGRCGACKRMLPPQNEPIDVDATSFAEIVAKATVPVLADFWAPWCGPCLLAAPEVKRVAIETAGKALILTVNTDDCSQLAAQFSVQSIPAFVVLHRGRAVFQQAGLFPSAEMRRWVETRCLNPDQGFEQPS